MIRHVCVRVGNFKFQNWHFYRWSYIPCGKKNHRYDWRKLI